MKTTTFKFKYNEYVISFDDAAKRLVVTMPNYRKDYARTATFPVWWNVSDEDKDTDRGLLGLFWEVLNSAAIGDECSNFDHFVSEHCQDEEDTEANTRTYDLYQECRIGVHYFRYRNWNCQTYCSGMMDALQCVIDFLRKSEEPAA